MSPAFKGLVLGLLAAGWFQPLFAQEQSWQGRLNVGYVSFRVILNLQTDSAGSVTAGAFTNIDDGIYDEPMRHWTVQDGWMTADLQSGEKFELRRDGERLSGRYTQAEGSFQSPGTVSTFHLKRGSDWSVPRLLASGAPAAAYVYQTPRQLKDGWEPENWAKAGLDEKILQAGLQKVVDGTYPHLHGVLALYRGKLVLDEYFYGYGPGDLHPAQSETKSVFSALVGLAAAQKRLQLTERLYDFFPDYRKSAGWDGKKDEITVGQLMTMTSGFACNDWKDAKACSWAMVHSPDWLAFSLSGPLGQDPGSRFAYCGACLLPLSVILERRTGMTVPLFAQKYLWDPLGVQKVHWFKGPAGVVPASFGLEIKPRDLLKLGALYLNQGRWGEKQILPADWVEASTAPQVPKSQTNGKNDYGYLWWERDLPFKGSTTRVFFAWGVGGQYLIVAPALDLACVITAGNYKDGRLGANSLKLFEENILAALP